MKRKQSLQSLRRHKLSRKKQDLIQKIFTVSSHTKNENEQELDFNLQWKLLTAHEKKNL